MGFVLECISKKISYSTDTSQDKIMLLVTHISAGGLGRTFEPWALINKTLGVCMDCCFVSVIASSQFSPIGSLVV